MTADQQTEAVRRLKVYKEWFYGHVMPPAEGRDSSALMVLPWTNGEPDYRDEYHTSEQKFTGIGFFFYNVGPYAEAPELIVPGMLLEYMPTPAKIDLQLTPRGSRIDTV